MTKGRLIRQWIGFLFMLAGLAVLSWPFISEQLALKDQKDSLQTVIKQMSGTGLEAESEEPESMSEEESEWTMAEGQGIFDAYVALREHYGSATDDAFDELYDLSKRYNESIVADGQVGLNSLQATENFDFDTRKYGFSENVIGAIWVPRLDVQLALYLGANTDNMSRGGAIFGKTSIPMSEGSANSAIAGHRGWRGAAFFRDIQQIQLDDPIYIVTPWEVLTYRVSELRIVTPDDNEWCTIQKGRNMITLMTCHPYTQHYQRYIVFADLSEEPFTSMEEIMAQMEATRDESPREVNEYDENGNRKKVLVDSTSIDPDGTEYEAFWSNLMILAESKMRIVLYVVIGLVALVGIWLIQRTVQYHRYKKKKE